MKIAGAGSRPSSLAAAMAASMFIALSLVQAFGAAQAQQTPQTPQTPRKPAPIVFFDVAAPDLPALRKFYSDLFGWTAGADANFSVPAASPLPAAFRMDPAAMILYIGVDDIDDVLKRIVEHGGSIEFGRLEVPGVAVIGMFKDPAGNRVGLVELANGKPKVP